VAARRQRSTAEETPEVDNSKRILKEVVERAEIGISARRLLRNAKAPTKMWIEISKSIWDCAGLGWKNDDKGQGI